MNNTSDYGAWESGASHRCAGSRGLGGQQRRAHRHFSLSLLRQCDRVLVAVPLNALALRLHTTYIHA